jgi:EAL and modified HD-GYP domain-containing signal transduction protein
MNAPEHRAQFAPLDQLEVVDALATLSICYAPLIDKHRQAIGTRLTMLCAKTPGQIPVGHILQQLQEVLPESAAPVLVAPLDASLDDTLLEWNAPRNLLLEIPTIALRDPVLQRLVQRARRKGVRMVLRGRPDVPLPPALLGCFEYSLIHLAEDRRRLKDGRMRPVPPNAVRRMPFVTTGVRSVADIDEAYQRGAMASVGWPMEETDVRSNHRLKPDQSNLMDLLRVASAQPDLDGIAARVRRDPVLVFKLLRMMNSGAFVTPAPLNSVRGAIDLLGREKTLRWLSLQLETATEDTNALPLMRAAMMRGLFLERLGGRGEAHAAMRDELFVTGAFSLLDRITGSAIPRLIGPVAMSGAVTEAIVHRTGPYAPYLALIEAIERSDPVSIRRQTEALAISVQHCNQALLSALATAQSVEVVREEETCEEVEEATTVPV